jgi:hypothetical protein
VDARVKKQLRVFLLQSTGSRPTREGGSSPDDPSDLFKEHLQLRLHVPTTRKVPKVHFDELSLLS